MSTCLQIYIAVCKKKNYNSSLIWLSFRIHYWNAPYYLHLFMIPESCIGKYTYAWKNYILFQINFQTVVVIIKASCFSQQMSLQCRCRECTYIEGIAKCSMNCTGSLAHTKKGTLRIILIHYNFFYRITLV